MNRRTTICLAILGLGWLAAALPTVHEPGPLADLAWMEGCWVQDGEGQYLEETWSPARADGMIGAFRWARAEKVWLYELMTIEAEDDDVVFRLRHFSRGLEPWKSEADEAMTYPLKSKSANEVVFENPDRDDPRRFVYRRDGDELTVRLEGPEEGSGDGFRFRLAP